MYIQIVSNRICTNGVKSCIITLSNIFPHSTILSFRPPFSNLPYDPTYPPCPSVFLRVFPAWLARPWRGPARPQRPAAQA